MHQTSEEAYIEALQLMLLLICRRVVYRVGRDVLIEEDLIYIAYRHKLWVGDQYKLSIHVFAGVEIVTAITDSVVK